MSCNRTKANLRDAFILHGTVVFHNRLFLVFYVRTDAIEQSLSGRNEAIGKVRHRRSTGLLLVFGRQFRFCVAPMQGDRRQGINQVDTHRFQVLCVHGGDVQITHGSLKGNQCLFRNIESLFS